MFSAVLLRGRGTPLLVLAGVCWGTGGLAGSVLGDAGGLHPLSVAAYRLLLGGVLVLLLLAVTTGVRPVRGTAAVRRVVLTGVLLGCYQASYFAAVSLATVSIATMITISSVPVFVTLADGVLRRRLPAPVTTASVLIAVLGLALLAGSPGAAADGPGFAAGVAFALLAGAGFAAMILTTGEPVDGLDAVHTTGYGCLVGGVLLLPMALPLGMAIPLSAETVAAALYLGAVPTALAYVAYLQALRVAHHASAALATLIEPLTATALAVAFFGDRLDAAGWCGAGLMIVALAANQLPGRPARV